MWGRGWGGNRSVEKQSETFWKLYRWDLLHGTDLELFGLQCLVLALHTSAAAHKSCTSRVGKKHFKQFSTLRLNTWLKKTLWVGAVACCLTKAAISTFRSCRFHMQWLGFIIQCGQSYISLTHKLTLQMLTLHMLTLHMLHGSLQW